MKQMQMQKEMYNAAASSALFQIWMRATSRPYNHLLSHQPSRTTYWVCELRVCRLQ